ncbi:hypothetical protein KSP9073_02877 [Kushneria phyllosphaerae]|uniref:Uncharacterized protein n=1 Tax=Kushneria phyllosphaerae TaxID=2100822 RepID=A0A2R8CPK0_9GAMM|nr:hypothetical protein KSP9073_02877 [Kushneria phyllosphaerae]
MFYTLHELASDVLVRHFATTESQRDLALIAFLKETRQILELDLIITFVSGRPEFDFLDLNLLLLLLLSRFLFFQFELMLAVIHDLANDRIGIGYLHEIKPSFFSLGKRLIHGHNTQLLALAIDKPNFIRTNTVIYGCALFLRAPTLVISLDRQVSIAEKKCCYLRSVSSLARNSGTVIVPRSSPVRVRTATLFDSTSLSPTTSR